MNEFFYTFESFSLFCMPLKNMKNVEYMYQFESLYQETWVWNAFVCILLHVNEFPMII